MSENSDKVQEKLKEVFDTVTEKDDVYTARRSRKYASRTDATSDMRKSLDKVFPDAEIVLVGSVGRPISSWYIQFTLK